MISLSSWGQSVGFMDSFSLCHTLLSLSPSILAMLLEQGAVNSPSLSTAALEKAPSCPMLWWLQGDKAFLSVCPSLLLSGDFVECRSLYSAVYIWAVSQSPLQQGGQIGAQHMKLPPDI